jgi:Zn-dependent metalloprotease
MVRRWIGVAAAVCASFIAAPLDAQTRERREAADPAGLQRLEAEAGSSDDVSVHPSTGTPRFVRLKKGFTASLSRRAAARGKEEQDARSQSFFSEHAAAYGLAATEGSLREVQERSDALGWRHHVFVQTYRSVPVFGAVLQAHFDDVGDLAAVTGTTVPHIAVDTNASVSADGARGAALASVFKNSPASGLQAARATLYVYRTGLAQGIDGANHLAYEVEVTNGADVRQMVYVDAHSGRILDSVNAIHDALHRRAYDAGGAAAPGPNYPASPFWVEGDPFPTSSTEANNMIIASKETYDLFFNAFGRDSFDGAGATMDSIFNRGNACPNASWNGVFISFCPGVTTDDVTAHEWGHAYTQYTHDLIYQWQPGALNESYSDIWGEIVDLMNGRGTDSPGGPRTAGTCSAFTPFPPIVRVNSPAAIAGDYPAGSAQFGGALTNTGVTGNVVLAIDAADAAGPSTTDGCSAISNTPAVSGNIAFLHRGTCGFAVKAKNAQDAGAVAVIIANVATSANPEVPPTMAGVDPTVTIVAVSLGFTNGQTIVTALPGGVNVTLRRNAPAVTDNSYRWLMGEDATGFGGAIRDMWTPTCHGDPGKVTDTQYVCTTGDNGGVHSNSGVPNHAFALLVDGGTYNGRTVGAIGATKAAHIYYRAMTVYQGPASDFADHADAIEQSCSDLVGRPLTALTGGPSGEVITEGDCRQVARAARAVELRTPPTQCNFQPLLSKNAPDRCDLATTRQVNIFRDRFERMPVGWTTTHETPSASFTPRDWEWVNELPDRRGSAFFAPDPIIGTCAPGGDETGVLHLDSPEIRLRDGVAAPRLTFDHWVATEAGWDGGNLKISVDGGAWNLIPATSFTFNPYNTTLQTAAAGNTNPLAGQPAFSGSDGGSVEGSWGRSFVNLTPHVAPGQTFRVRFSLGTDGCNGLFGWYMDDFTVYTCTSKTKPSMTINDVAVQEGDRGTTDAVFTISLSHASASPVSVEVRLKAGTARLGDDFFVRNFEDEVAIVTIKPLTLSTEFTVKVRGDRRREDDETFFVLLDSAKNAVIEDRTGMGTILDNDGPTTLTSAGGGGSDR